MRDVARSSGSSGLFAFPRSQVFVIRAEPMPEAKGHDGRQVDRENETRQPATGHDWPADLDLLFRDLDDLLGQIEAKSSFHTYDDPLLPSIAMRAVLELAQRRLEDIELGSTDASGRGESAARIEDAWRRAMIEAQGWAQRGSSPDDEEEATSRVSVAALAEEIATYRRCLPELLRQHEGEFVLIKGTEIAGFFPDLSAGLREGYRRFGIVPLLIRQIAVRPIRQSISPTWCSEPMPRLDVPIGPDGPIIDVRLWIGPDQRDVLISSGRPVPSPLSVAGLVDTGAGSTAILLALAEGMDLNILNWKMLSSSAFGDEEVRPRSIKSA